MSGFFYRQYKTFEGEILHLPGRLVAFIFFLALLLLPLVSDDPFLLRVLIFANIFSIFAVSWDFLSGFTGQLNFGHALFFGIAAYTSALINIHVHLPPWVTIPLGACAGVLGGLIVGIPALRLRGHYLALVTLAFPMILAGIVMSFPDFLGGELGLSGIRGLSGARIHDYYITLLVMIACVLIMWKLTDISSEHVRTGVIIRAIREDEITARASGINTTAYKLLAFSISGLFAGIAGGLYTHFMKVVGPSTLEVLFSFQAIIWTIFGGMGTIFGPVVGVFVLYAAMEMLHISRGFQLLLLPVLVIAVLLFMPEGLGVWVLDKIEIKCPRCKLINYAMRRNCKVCGTPLRLSPEESSAKAG